MNTLSLLQTLKNTDFESVINLPEYEEYLNILIELNPESIKYLNKPRYAHFELAVKKCPECIKYVPFNNANYNNLASLALSLDYKVIKFVSGNIFEVNISDILKKDGLMLEFIDNQTIPLCFTALQQNIKSFVFIKEKTEGMIEFALKKDAELFAHVKNKEDYEDLAISINPSLIKMIAKPSMAGCLKALAADGMLLSHFKNNQTYEMKITALKQNPKAIEFVENLTFELKNFVSK
jgi:hypothetical protein